MYILTSFITYTSSIIFLPFNLHDFLLNPTSINACPSFIALDSLYLIGEI